MDKVRYSYVWPQGSRGMRDSYVLSIARQYDKDKGEVQFGWALNVPPRWVKCVNKKFEGEMLLDGDHFSRREGRRLAEQRLREKPVVTYTLDDELPIVAVLEHIRNSPYFPENAREIARQELIFNKPTRKKKTFLRKVIEFIKK